MRLQYLILELLFSWILKMQLQYEILELKFWELMKIAAPISHIRVAVFWSLKNAALVWDIRATYLGLHKIAAPISHIWAAILRIPENCSSNISYYSRIFETSKLQNAAIIWDIGAAVLWSPKYVALISQTRATFLRLQETVTPIWDIGAAVFINSVKSRSGLHLRSTSDTSDIPYSFTPILFRLLIFLPILLSSYLPCPVSVHPCLSFSVQPFLFPCDW